MVCFLEFHFSFDQVGARIAQQVFDTHFDMMMVVPILKQLYFLHVQQLQEML